MYYLQTNSSDNFDAVLMETFKDLNTNIIMTPP